jgi:hypothetical protein
MKCFDHKPGSTAILAVWPAGILSAIGQTRRGEPAEKSDLPGETPGCPTGKMPVLRIKGFGVLVRQ